MPEYSPPDTAVGDALNRETVRWAAGPVAVGCERNPAARRRPKAAGTRLAGAEQARPTPLGTLWVRRGSVAVSPPEGHPREREPEGWGETRINELTT